MKGDNNMAVFENLGEELSKVVGKDTATKLKDYLPEM